MEFEWIRLPKITVIGKEGLCTRQRNIVSDLWTEANEHFQEIAALGKKQPNGSYAGFWGAMSDVSKQFKPWEDNFTTGLYLAGLEVEEHAEAPSGWTKWILPARNYLVTDMISEQYAEIFSQMIHRIIPEKKLKLTGAVCDFTDPSTEQSKLFFPVEAFDNP